MKIRDLISQLKRYYKLNDDIYCEYWDVQSLQDLYEPDDDVMPIEAVKYIIHKLDSYWHNDNDNLLYAVQEYYDEWKDEQVTNGNGPGEDTTTIPEDY